MSSVYWILGKVREGLHPEKLSGLVWNSPEPPERHNKNRTKNYTQIEMKNQNPNVHSFFADWHFSMKFLWKKKFSIKVHIDFSANIDRMECWEWIEIWEFAVYNLHIFYLCNAMFIINYNILYCISMTACDSVTVWQCDTTSLHLYLVRWGCSVTSVTPQPSVPLVTSLPSDQRGRNMENISVEK